jgi:hypothetical protein
MTATLNASTSSGVILTSDTSGNLDIQSNGTSKVSVTSGATTIANLSATVYTPTASLITSGTAQSPSSGVGVNFTSIPSWVKRITISLAASVYSANANRVFQLGSGSYTTTGYNCLAAYYGSGTASSSYGAGFGLYGDGSPTWPVSGIIVFTLVNSATNLWTASGNFVSVANVAMSTAGYIALSGVLDRVRMYPSNGTDTCASGTYNILYE